MSKLIFYNFSDSGLIVFGFILFMTTFLGNLIWILLIRDKSFYEKLSTQILINEEEYESKQ